MKQASSISLIQILSSLLLLSSLTAARQIRINRFGKEILLDVRDEAAAENSTESQVNTAAPYPAAGYRPSKAFNLPGEIDETTITPTTATPLAPFTVGTPTSEPLVSTTTTDYYDYTTTTMPTTTEDAENDDAEQPQPAKAPYPPSGYRPSKAFNLPTENQVRRNNEAPYPAAGYRPDRAFLLPNEIPSAALTTLADGDEAAETVSTTNANTVEKDESPKAKTAAAEDTAPATAPKDNSKNPVCGVSLNPLRPTPPPGTKDDPDAERVFVPGVVLQPAPVPLATLLQYPAAQQILVPARPSSSYAYSAQFQSW